MQKKAPKILWHKCNSVLTFMKAVLMEIEGLSGIEFDVVCTKDNIPVLMHDRMITKDGVNIEISDLTLSELLSINSRITTLEAALEGINHIDFSDNFEFHLEIKPDNLKLTDKILKTLKYFPKINSQTIIRSFQPEVIKHVKNTAKRPVCLLLSAKDDTNSKIEFPGSRSSTALDSTLDKIDDIKKICGGFLPEQISINYTMITENFSQLLKTNNIESEIHTLNDLRAIGGIKVDRIVTDEPHTMINNINDQNELIANVG